MSIENFDVAILGGGMAGLSAAVNLCAETNLSIVLIEMHGIGSNQTIRAIYSEAICEFELQESVIQGYTKFIYHSPLGALASFDYEQETLCGVDYQIACQLLWERANRNGLETRFSRAIGLSPNPPDPDAPLQIILSNGNIIRAQVLIDASGPNQWAARWLKLGRSKLFSVCYGELLSGCAIEEPSTFRFLAGNSKYGNGGGWVYPLQKDRISQGYSIVVSENADRSHLFHAYQAFKHEFSPYAEWTKAGKRERIEGGLIPVGRIATFTQDRLLILGDAGGQAHPWSVEGCRPALRNGQAGARVIKDAFCKNKFDQKTLSAFEKEWEKRNSEKFWRTASCADVAWRRTDQENDRLIARYQKLDAHKQMVQLRDNSATWFEQIYARGGFARRQFMKWLGDLWLS